MKGQRRGNIADLVHQGPLRPMGVRTNVPFSALTSEEREIVFYGPAEKKHILYRPKKSDTNDFAELDFTYFNAVYC